MLSPDQWCMYDSTKAGQHRLYEIGIAKADALSQIPADRMQIAIEQLPEVCSCLQLCAHSSHILNKQCTVNLETSASAAGRSKQMRRVQNVRKKKKKKLRQGSCAACNVLRPEV